MKKTIDRCADCEVNLDHTANTPVPSPDDDKGWAALAIDHAPDCQWWLTRGYQRELVGAERRI